MHYVVQTSHAMCVEWDICLVIQDALSNMEGQHVENKIINKQTSFVAFSPIKLLHVDSNAQLS